MQDHAHPASAKPGRALALFIAGSAALRLIFGATTGLGIDETYMVAIGRRWEWSYFDHPPLAWWLAHAASLLAGSEADWIVRTPFIALFALSTWLMFELTSLLFGQSAGLIAALALNAAPVLGVTTGTWVLPDGPLDAALLAGALCLARVLLIPGANPALWLLAGLFGGLALLSKLHGVFLFAGAGLFLLTSAQRRRWLATPWPWLGMLVATGVASPAIVWNAQHQWASIAFQGARASAHVFRPWMPLIALAGQAAFLAPWIWAPLVFATAMDVRKGPADPAAWLLICLAIGPIALFTLTPAWSDQRPYFHWAAPGYLMLFPLLGRWFTPGFDHGSARIRTWLRASLVFVAAAVAGMIALAQFPMISAIAGLKSDPLAEMTDWTGVAPYVRAQETATGTKFFVVARRWYEAAKIDHALAGASDVVCIGEDCRGYDFLAPRDSHAGESALIFVPENALAALSPIERRFSAIAPLPDLTIARGPLVTIRLKVFRGENYLPR